MGIDDVFAVIAESTRRQILENLRDGDKAVGELVIELQVSQPTVSKHLKVLREAGLVTMRAQGQKRFYRRSRTSSRRSTGLRGATAPRRVCWPQPSSPAPTPSPRRTAPGPSSAGPWVVRRSGRRISCHSCAAGAIPPRSVPVSSARREDYGPLSGGRARAPDVLSLWQHQPLQ
jgi:DNA-binding transcriptional ArsR family regulator